jgi:hypothetical protein
MRAICGSEGRLVHRRPWRKGKARWVRLDRVKTPRPEPRRRGRFVHLPVWGSGRRVDYVFGKLATVAWGLAGVEILAAATCSSSIHAITITNQMARFGYSSGNPIQFAGSLNSQVVFSPLSERTPLRDGAPASAAVSSDPPLPLGAPRRQGPPAAALFCRGLPDA